MHFIVYSVFYSVNSHQHVSAAIAAIFSVMLILQQYKGTNVISCVTFNALQLKSSPPHPMPSHVLVNFHGFPPGCGDSVADF